MFKKGNVPWNKGKPTGNYGNGFVKGFKHTQDTKLKMSKARKGKKRDRPQDMIWRAKASKRMKGKQIPNEHLDYWKGKKMSPEHRKKIGRKGAKNKLWKGGYENRLANNRKRRVRKTGNGGSHSLGDWETLKAQYDWTCPCCKKSEPEINLTEDHIIPLVKGGSDNIENIQPLCKSCNCRKHIQVVKY